MSGRKRFPDAIRDAVIADLNSGYTQREAAARNGVSQGYVSKVVNERMPLREGRVNTDEAEKRRLVKQLCSMVWVGKP